MCGVFGVFYFDRATRPESEQLKAAARILAHRGPDDQSWHRGPGIGLAHTRLSLLDLQSRSNQPLWDASGRYCIVYNGELYNYLELRRNLQKRGVSFRTSSDTEVLLYSVIKNGRAALADLRGMYAFAFYDSQDHTLLLARDPFGIKPLYVLDTPSAILFSSESKGFHPWRAPQPNKAAVLSFMAGGTMPTQPATFFDGVRSVRAGGYVTASSTEGVAYGQFFSLGDLYEAPEFARLSSARTRDVIDEAESLLVASVRRHMIADAPVGAFCSGGIDSALILALAARDHKNLSVFHADVTGPRSERSYAELLAKSLDLDLHVTTVRDDDFVEEMADVIFHYEQPFTYHPNSVPFLLVSRLVNRYQTKAVLTGEGADESLLGYSDLPLRFVVENARRALMFGNRAIRSVPFVGPRVALSTCEEISTVHSITTEMEIELERAAIEERLGPEAPPGTLTTLSYLGYHLRTLLTRNDRLGMAAHIEARFPFLDLDFVKFCVNLPYKYKIRKGTLLGSDFKHPFIGNKWILRKVAQRYLPHKLSTRPKRGFPTDAYERLYIDPGFLPKSCLLTVLGVDATVIRSLWEHTSHDAHLRMIHLEIWARRFILGQSTQRIRALLAPYLRAHT